MAIADPDVAAQAERHHDLRHSLEAAVPPLATSLDGRTFRLRAPMGMSLRTGGSRARPVPPGAR